MYPHIPGAIWELAH